MARIMIITLCLAAATVANAGDSGNFAAGERIEVTAPTASFELTVSHNPADGSRKLIVNMSNALIEIFDLNMQRIDAVKPRQSVDLTEILHGHGLVAISIGGGNAVYVDVSNGTVAIARNGQEDAS